MTRRLAVCAAALATCGLGLRAASADEAVWAIAGREVLRLQDTGGAMKGEKRAETLDMRVNNILSKGNGTLGAADIVLRQEKGRIFITVRGDLLVTVTPQDAAAHETTREELGQTWLASLRKTLPLLAPRENKGGA